MRLGTGQMTIWDVDLCKKTTSRFCNFVDFFADFSVEYCANCVKNFVKIEGEGKIYL